MPAVTQASLPHAAEGAGDKAVLQERYLLNQCDLISITTCRGKGGVIPAELQRES